MIVLARTMLALVALPIRKGEERRLRHLSGIDSLSNGSPAAYHVISSGTKGADATRSEESTTIDRPIDEVFAYLADVEKHPDWVSPVLATKKTSDGPMGLGATFAQEGKVLGRQTQVAWEITAYEPPHTIQQRTQLGSSQTVLTATLEATNGGTKVTLVQERIPKRLKAVVEAGQREVASDGCATVSLPILYSQ